MANGSTPSNVQVDIGGWLRDAWQLFVDDAVTWILLALSLIVIFVVLGNIPVVGGLAAWVLIGPLSAGMFAAAFAKLRGESISVGMLFAPAMDDFVPLALVGAVGSLLQGLGLIACIVGVFLTFPLWMFGIPLVLEQQLPFWDALELSRKSVQGQLMQWVLFAFVIFLLDVVGSLLFGVGLLVTVPLIFLMIAMAYRAVFGLQAPAPAPGPATPGS